MKRWLNEPLLHFLVLGALLFGVYGWLHRGQAGSWDNGAPVRITSREMAFLAETWERQHQRPPTREELHALAAGYLKEELLGREARAMGLDQDDLVIRRRLAQKVEFIVKDTSRLAAPTDDDLHRFYEANLDSFRTRAHVSFTQVFFDPEKRRDAAADVNALLAALSRGSAITSRIGDPFPLDGDLSDEDRQSVAGQYGGQFADAVFALKPGGWQGPIASSFGLHLVRVTDVRPARQLEFSEVEPQVRERWRDEHQRESDEQYFASLLKKYHVVVDEDIKPLVGPASELAAQAKGLASQPNATVAQVPQ
jgi:hypothetical protein